LDSCNAVASATVAACGGSPSLVPTAEIVAALFICSGVNVYAVASFPGSATVQPGVRTGLRVSTTTTTIPAVRTMTAPRKMATFRPQPRTLPPHHPFAPVCP